MSIGITQALATDLATRLPTVAIESRGTHEPAQRLLVDVERFEIAEGGRRTLTARWRITMADGKTASNSDQETFVVMATSTTGAAASRMSAAGSRDQVGDPERAGRFAGPRRIGGQARTQAALVAPALGWIWIYLRVPETRGLTLEKIQEMEGVKA